MIEDTLTALWASRWILAALVVAVWLAFGPVARAVESVSDRHQQNDADQAADFDEPTRAEVEAGWLNEDDETWNYPGPLEFICIRCRRIVDGDLEPGGHDGRCPDCTGQVAREDGAA